MPTIQIRQHFGTQSPADLVATISDKTHDHLMNSDAESNRESSYLDRDWPRVEAKYEELYVGEACKSRFNIKSISPGSKTRWTVTLPDAMKEGEQLTLQVARVIDEKS